MNTSNFNMLVVYKILCFFIFLICSSEATSFCIALLLITLPFFSKYWEIAFTIRSKYPLSETEFFLNFYFVMFSLAIAISGHQMTAMSIILYLLLDVGTWKWFSKNGNKVPECCFV